MHYFNNCSGNTINSNMYAYSLYIHHITILHGLVVTLTDQLTLTTSIVNLFFFSSRRRHTRSYGDWSSDVYSSDLWPSLGVPPLGVREFLAQHVPEAAVLARVLVALAQRDDVARPRELHLVHHLHASRPARSEERRVGKERATRCGRDQQWQTQCMR